MRVLRMPIEPTGALATRRGAVAGLAALAVLLCAAAPARAALVGYQWVAGPGSTGTGTMVFDLGSGTDGANFSVPQSSLVSFSFIFADGSSVSLANLNSISVATGNWSAVGGYLTTTAQLSDTIVPRYTFQIVPYSLASPNPNGSTAVALDTAPVQQNFGVWRLDPTSVSAVPLPAAAWLFGAGAVALSAFGRRRFAAR